MDFSTFIRIITFRWKIVVAAVVACLIGAAILTATQSKTYQASSTILMSVSGAATINEYWESTQAQQHRLLAYTEIARTHTVAQRAIDQLQVPMTAEQLAANTTVSFTPESMIFKITVTDTDPDRVVELASAVTDQFSALIPQLQPPHGDGPPPPYTFAQVVEQPTVPTNPISPVPIRNLALGLLAGLLLGIVLALIRNATDRTVRTRETLARVSGLPVLAELPKHHISTDGSAKGGTADPVYEEAVRGFRTRLLAIGGQEPRSLLLTGPSVDAAVTTTSLNLAVSFTEIGDNVVLVEGDPHPPVIADLLGIESSVGLDDVLAERSGVDDAIHATARNDLWVLASNEATGADPHVRTAMLERTIEKLCAHFERLVIAGPPTLATADALILAGAAQATVLVVRVGKTTVDELQTAVENLRETGANVVGAVMTDARVSRHVKAAARTYRAKVGEPE